MPVFLHDLMLQVVHANRKRIVMRTAAHMRTSYLRGFGWIGLIALTLVAPLLAVVATNPQPARADETIISHDFEDGTTQGWTPRGGETVAHSTEVAHSGTGSLAVTGRTQTWEGPVINLLDHMVLGSRYTFTVWVRLAAGEPSTSVRLSLERRIDGTPTYEGIVGNTTVTADGWVRLTGTYLLAHEVEFLTAYVESDSATASFYIDDFSLVRQAETPIQTDIPPLQDVLADHFPIGAAIERQQIIGRHGQLLTRHFNSVTPGNALKWDATQPSEGTFTFTEADALVGYARDNGMQVRGHTLVWHNQTPAWVFQDAAGNPLTPTPENRELLLSRLENHIRTVVGRYADDIYAWDVVNEVIDESQPDGMRRSVWYEITGLDYIRTAFRVAHEVDPDALLFINDYNTNVPAKRQALYNLVAQLRAEGIPIHGVGHQMHINIDWPSVTEIEQTIELFEGLGVDQQITEMDMSIYTDSTSSYDSIPPELLIRQGERYRDIFEVYRAHSDAISSVTLWGLADDDTWLSTFPITRLDAPLLFDTQLQAKPAYWGIVDPDRITASPSTSVSVSASASASVSPSASESQQPSGCTISYQIVSQWHGGFQGEVRITCATPLTGGWRVGWTYLNGQQITQLWNGSVTQTGSRVEVTNVSYNGDIGAGQSVVFGFLGTWNGVNEVPTTFTLNGQPVSVS